MLTSDSEAIVVDGDLRLRRSSVTAALPLSKTDAADVAVFACETNTEFENKSDNGLVIASQVAASQMDCGHEETRSSMAEPEHTSLKRPMSIQFSTTVKRNRSTVQILHAIPDATTGDVSAGLFPDNITSAGPPYTQPSRSRSIVSNTSKEIEPASNAGSIYARPKHKSGNIKFSTAQRCTSCQQTLDHSVANSVSSTWSYQSKIYQETPTHIYDAENELVKVSRQLLRLQKYGLLMFFIGINAALIWATFAHYSDIWWFIIPLLSVNTFSQVLFALMIMATVGGLKLWKCIRRSKEEEPEEPEKIVMLLPCYNEDRNEMRASIDSLVRQVKIDKHPRIIMIVVDGNAKAPGEVVSTQDFLLNDMLAGGERTVFSNGYIARDAQPMAVTVQEGIYQGVPYIVIGKARNQGKRDSLCLVRSFMWHYRNNSENIPTMFDPDLFDYIGSILTDNGLDKVDYLTGMDGDTVFEDDCTYQLIKTIRKAGPKVVGVCGAVLVKFNDAPPGFFNKISFYFWTLLQNAEYMSTQGLRREFQSRVTGKVNCLPGCCQLIRVSEATFGDQVLRVKFGYVPKPNDLMTRQIMGVYSEDSLHASIIFSLFPNSQTAQALRARAYTTVPTSWKVYLSQRKRWALGSLCNESLMVFRRNILWIERICSIITIATWWIGPFIYSAVIGFLISIVHRGGHLLEDKAFAGLVCVILFRYFYTFMIVTWFPHTWLARAQFLAGFFMNLVISPIVNLIITIYSLLHCDEFSWGKTRMTAEGDTSHGGLPTRIVVEPPQPVVEKAMVTDVESQSPTSQEREAHALAKFERKDAPFG